MIKCNVTVSGTVSKVASCRTNKEGKPFVTFAVSMVIPARNGINKTIEVGVVKDGTLTEVGNFQTGARIEVTGVLAIKKRGEAMYFNLRADSVSATPISDKDGIAGDMEFRGKVGRSIEEKQDKNGNPFLQFSAFSTEKVGESFEYVWVRFFRFDSKREDWMQQGVRVSVKGSLELSVYNDRLGVSCRVTEMSEAAPPQPSPVGRETSPL